MPIEVKLVGRAALPARRVGRAANWLVTFAGVELAIADVGCGADGCTLQKRAACDCCGACADGCAAKRLFTDVVATCGKPGCRAKRENDVTD